MEAESQGSPSLDGAEGSVMVETADVLEVPVAEKADHIRRACEARDLEALVSYATSEGGLLNDELRRLACM